MSTYTKPTISNYNDNPPTNDGSENFVDNGVDWDRHIDEIGDPLKSYIDAVNNAVDAGFTKVDNSHYLSALDVGAEGNGTTDDASAIQSGIDKLEAAGGGVLYFPEGTYLIKSKITMGSDIGLVGEGHSASVIQGDNLTTALVSSPATGTRYYRWLMRDIGFDNVSRSNAGGIGIDLTNITSGTFNNVTVKNAETGINLVKSGASGGAFYNDFYSLRVITTTNGIVIGETANENRFFGGRINDVTTGVSIDNNTKNSFRDFAIEVFTTGVTVGPSNITQYTSLDGLRLENIPTAGTGILLSSDAQATAIHWPVYIGLTTDITDNGVNTIISQEVSFKTGPGDDIRQIDKTSSSITFTTPVPANSVEDKLITVSGATTSDHWFVTPPSSIETNLMVMAIPASGGVNVRVANISTGSQAIAGSQTFVLTRVRYN